MKIANPLGERTLVERSASNEPMALDSFGGRIHVRWSPDEAVTSLGQLPFFIDFLKQADLIDLSQPVRCSLAARTHQMSRMYLARCCCPL